ncbi:DNA (cytosine-5-)-methyltransferase [Exiguobacterium mexicanum]
MKYKVVDLFAGIGGMTKAFSGDEFQVTWAIEIQTKACEIYKHNNQNIDIFKGDIRKINVNENIATCDIVALQLPINIFQNSTYEKHSQKKIMDIVFEIIQIKQPQVVVLETIKGIRTYDNGITFKQITTGLKSLGYFIEHTILNLKDHAGIPHNKERLYLVAFKSKQCSQSFSFPDLSELKTSLNDVINTSDKKDNWYYISETNQLYGLFHENFTEKNVVYAYRGGKNIRKYSDGVCPSLTSKPNFYILDDYGVRRFTIEEYLKLNDLHEHKIPNGITRTKTYELISNTSLVTPLAKIATSINMALVENNILPKEESSQEGTSELSNELESKSDKFTHLLSQIESETNSQEKGKILEVLIKIFFEEVKNFEVSTNIRTRTEEIDIVIKNNSKKNPWKEEGVIIIGECKNWNKKCGKNDFVIFKQKIENRNKRVRLGFFISWAGFTDTYLKERLRSSGDETLIIPIDGDQIKKAIESGCVEKFLMDMYYDIILT